MKNFYVITFIICFGCLTSEGQRVLFTDNFGAYSNGESLSANSSGWDTTGVSDFTNKINATFGASGSSCFGQLATTGAATAYQELQVKAGNTYVFKAYLKTTNNKIYSTIRINVGGTDVATSGNVSANFSWEELSISYTPSVDETAKFVIQKTQGQVLNVDKVKIICTSCANKRFVYDFHDSKENWVSGGGCTLGLNDKGMVLNATSQQPIARSGDVSQNLALNTADYNRAKITFKTPYAMGGQGLGKFYLYDINGGNSQFATYDFVRDAGNTTTFQTAEVDLTSNGNYTGIIARIGVRAPWGIASGGKAFIQRIELYYECSELSSTDVINTCESSYTWIDGNTYTSDVTPVTHKNHTVSTSGMTFSPDNISINKGDTITFVNTGGNHNVNGNKTTYPGNPESFGNSVGSGWSYSYVFETPGEYQYQCDPHAPSMAGSISVADVVNVTHLVSNTNGCDSAVTLDLTFKSVDDSVTVVDEFTLQANASGATYQWIDCGNSDTIAGETDSVFTTQVSGDYAVVITQNGCTDTSDCFTISNTVGIQDIKKQYQVELYPNPALNEVTFTLKGIESVNIELIDIQGKLLLSQNEVFNQARINLPDLAPGTYFVRILSDFGNQQIKVRVK